MISKKSGRRKGKNFNKTYMRETLKKALTKEELKSLKEKMLMSILQGSMACNGVYFNRYRNFKRGKIKCLKQLSQ